MPIIFIYTPDETLIDDIESHSAMSELVGETWTTLPIVQREIQPDLVYEIQMTVSEEVDFAGVVEILDYMTDGTCLIVQTL